MSDHVAKRPAWYARTEQAKAGPLVTDRPHAARVYDYHVSGKRSFAAERVAPEAVESSLPQIRLLTRLNRAFLRRAVRHLTAFGVRQFIDIGAGLSSEGSTHEIAQRYAPHSRVVYVDNDPFVLAHGRALLADNSNAKLVMADLRCPDEVLGNSGLRSLIDFSQPVGILLIAVTHFLSDEERRPVLGALRSAMAPSSYLALTHVTADNSPPEAVAAVEAVYQATAAPLHIRTRAGVLPFFDGFTMVDPGLTFVNTWHPDPTDPGPDTTGWVYGGVARLE